MPTMPHWAQWVILTSLFLGAIGVIWTKLIRPLGKLIAYLHDAIPLNQQLVDQFKDNQNYVPVLKEIASQFKTDSGSSLRDVVNRIEEAAKRAEVAAEELRIKAGILKEEVAIVKALATTDRAEAAHKLVLLDGLVVSLKQFEAVMAAQQAATVTQNAVLPAVIPTEQKVIAIVAAKEPESKKKIEELKSISRENQS